MPSACVALLAYQADCSERGIPFEQYTSEIYGFRQFGLVSSGYTMVRRLVLTEVLTVGKLLGH